MDIAGEALTAREAFTDTADAVLRFVNIRADGAGHVEQFASADGFGIWAGREGLLDADTVVTDSDAAAAQELRDALVTVFLAHSQAPGAGDAEISSAHRYLRQAGMPYPLATVITVHGAQPLPGATGVPGAAGSVLAAVTVLAQQGEWTRIKACCSPSCHEGLVDRTRNRRARYCSAGCGSPGVDGGFPSETAGEWVLILSCR